MTETSETIRTSEDGRYVLLAPDQDSDGYHRLAFTDGTELAFVGYVSDPENFLTAVDEAEEEMRCLLAEAREELGL